ncbi:MAG: transcription termination/antitermination protein NusG [Alphaproteobacteria bacterium]|nr:transcription termination/antitermination protein NusG [Alphaproteobacteria bacterium]
MAMQWYVVHTYSGYENKAKQSLEERIRAHDLEDRFGDVLVPTEQVTEVRGGQKRNVTRKFFPGYILVNMELDSQTWHVVNSTPRITGFVGNSRNPPPLPLHEVQRITSQMDPGEDAAPRPKLNFEKGEEVRVTDGPFASMKGLVEEINDARGKLSVRLNIFGRPTRVELDFTQVEKLS